MVKTEKPELGFNVIDAACTETQKARSNIKILKKLNFFI